VHCIESTQTRGPKTHEVYSLARDLLLDEFAREYDILSVGDGQRLGATNRVSVVAEWR
jgi:hypothetical protein